MIKDFSDVRILVAGDIMLDRYWWGSVERISPEAPVPVVRLEDMSLVAGGAANVAANLAGLGATPYLFGVKGNDAEGALLDQVLTESGIENSNIMPIAARKTTIKTRIVAHSQHVVRIDQESAAPIDDDMSKQILSAMTESLASVDAVVVSDYGKGFLSDILLKGLIDSARSLGKPVVVDPKGKDFSKYLGATIITPNKREAAEACSLDFALPNVVAKSGKILLSEIALEALIITEGENGMTVFERSGDTTHLSALAHNVYDVTGAGDTVIAALAVSLAGGAGILESAQLANAAAGLVVGKIGTTRVTSEMLSEFLASAETLKSIHA